MPLPILISETVPAVFWMTPLNVLLAPLLPTISVLVPPDKLSTIALAPPVSAPTVAL